MLRLPLAATAAAVTAAAGLWRPGPSPIVTSLDTIPTGYFGGSGGTGGKSRSRRTDAEIAALAQQRVVVIEKWEGPCWDECLSNSSHTPPIACSSSCGEEAYQLDTIRRIKAVNPNVSTVFYLNSMCTSVELCLNALKAHSRCFSRGAYLCTSFSLCSFVGICR